MYTLIALIPLLISLYTAYPILKQIESSDNDDSLGISTFSAVLKQAGVVKTITIYGGIMAGFAIGLAPTLIDVLNG